MTWTLKAHTFAQGSGSTTVTTPAIDTTGADLIVVILATGGAGITLNDSNSNTWINAVTSGSNTFNGVVLIDYVQAPTVGTGHTFTISGGSNLGSLLVQAWSGSIASPLDQTNSLVTNSTTTSQSGSVTPVQSNELVITGTNFSPVTGTVTTISVNSGFTQPDAFVQATANNYGSTMAYLVQGAAAAINPTWTYDVSSHTSAAIASFKGAVSVPPWGWSAWS